MLATISHKIWHFEKRDAKKKKKKKKKMQKRLLFWIGSGINYWFKYSKISHFQEKLVTIL